jgi:hypothetical protein
MKHRLRLLTAAGARAALCGTAALGQAPGIPPGASPPIAEWPAGDAARLGHKALLTLWEIDQKCRSLLKHGSPTPEARKLAEEIRGMIPGEMLDT